MTRQLLGVLIIMASALAACGGPASSSTVTPAATTEPAASPGAARSPTAVAIFKPPSAQTSVAGNVTVIVTPQALKAGEPAEFEIAMDTHSVDLAGDMLALVVLRDERGSAQNPTAWDGPAAGGHHRSGTIRFDALPLGIRSVTLIIKNIAGVPERVFTWDVTP